MSDFVCNDCGCEIEDGEEIDVYDYVVCSSCASKYFTCDGCGNLFLESDVSIENGECYCDDCNDRNIPDYYSNGNSDWWRDE